MNIISKLLGREVWSFLNFPIWHIIACLGFLILNLIENGVAFVLLLILLMFSMLQIGNENRFRRLTASVRNALEREKSSIEEIKRLENYASTLRALQIADSILDKNDKVENSVLGKRSSSIHDLASDIINFQPKRMLCIEKSLSPTAYGAADFLGRSNQGKPKEFTAISVLSSYEDLDRIFHSDTKTFGGVSGFDYFISSYRTLEAMLASGVNLSSILGLRNGNTSRLFLALEKKVLLDDIESSAMNLLSLFDPKIELVGTKGDFAIMTIGDGS